MKNKYLIVSFIIVVVLFSCAGRGSTEYYPVRDPEYSLPVITIDRSSISGTRDRRLPEWLNAYINGGIGEVEKLSYYNNKYVFIGYSGGVNFAAQEKWAQNFSAVRDLPAFAAVRIERRMISASSFYPDDEYGPFFEKMMKNAYSAEYPGAVKEDTYWIKMNNVNDGEVFMFFVLVTIDKTAMHSIIENMIDASAAASSVTSIQNAAIRHLRQIFFEEF
jgi:hypothetical protein